MHRIATMIGFLNNCRCTIVPIKVTSRCIEMVIRNVEIVIKLSVLSLSFVLLLIIHSLTLIRWWRCMGFWLWACLCGISSFCPCCSCASGWCSSRCRSTHTLAHGTSLLHTRDCSSSFLPGLNTKDCLEYVNVIIL